MYDKLLNNIKGEKMRLKLFFWGLITLMLSSCVTADLIVGKIDQPNTENFLDIEFIKDVFADDLQEVHDYNGTVIGYYNRIDNNHDIIKTKGIVLYNEHKDEIYRIIPDAEGSTTVIHFKDANDNKGYLKITPKVTLTVSFNIDLKFLNDGYSYDVKSFNTIVKHNDEVIYFQEPVINGNYENVSINKMSFPKEYIDSNLSDAILWGGIIKLSNELGQESAAKQPVVIKKNYYN